MQNTKKTTIFKENNNIVQRKSYFAR